jgi:glycerophosphoryl diester phosphodiesterase
VSAAAFPYPRVFAHRGGGALAPENTLAGLRVAGALGLRAVEFDVMLGASGTPYLIHDAAWERTTDGRGRVEESSDDYIAGLDAGFRFAPAFAGERVPTLEQAARLCIELGLAANVEIKPSPGAERVTGRRVAEAALRLWAGAALPPLLSSFSEGALEGAMGAAPRLPRGLLFEVIPDDWDERVRRLGCSALHCDRAANDRQRIADIAARGTPVVCYTVNDPDEGGELLAAGAAALITDRLDLFRP